MEESNPKDQETGNTDEAFFERADAHINLANSYINKGADSQEISTSLMFGSARFNAWISACQWHDGKELLEAKKAVLDYFITEYRNMLEHNLDDYISNFDEYMGNKEK